MSMQQFIIDWSRKNFFVVEEVHLLFVRQCDVRMFAQKIMQRGRARFLCAGNNEIESFELLWLGSEHRRILQLASFNWRGRPVLSNRLSPFQGERIKVRGFAAVAAISNPHPTLSLKKGEAKS